MERMRPGMRLPGILRDRSGTVLADAGVCLSTKDLMRIRNASQNGLYGDSDWPEEFAVKPSIIEISNDKAPETLSGAVDQRAELDRNGGRPISVDSLHPGMCLTQDLYDAETAVLLLAAGVQVTLRFLELLSSRGIKSVKLRPKQPEETRQADGPFQNAQTRALDEILEGELQKVIPLRQLSATERPRLALPDLKAEALRGLEQHAATSGLVAEMCADLAKGREISATDMSRTLNAFVGQATLDIDLLPLVMSLQRSEDEYLYDHCVNVALISMSVAAQAGMNRDRIAEIGCGAMLQDVGMLRVPEGIRLAHRSIEPDERYEINRHPIHTLDWLEKIKGLAPGPRFIGYQCHERVDGQGYPRRRSGMFVHQYAKLVAIADSFCAMSRPRPYREAMLPYEAARAVLRDIQKFDRIAVRMFLDTVGLFPIGSCVELETGLRGKVVRATPGHHTRPLIEELDDDGKATGRVIDLSKERQFKAMRAVKCPRAAVAAEVGV